MTERLQLTVIDRRDLVLGTGAVAALAAILPLSTIAMAEEKVTWKDAMKAVVGDSKPAEGKVSLDLPEIAENGNTVPFTVTVDSPMTDGDYVKSVHVYATGNPRPDVASFFFSPQSGKAEATTRMRLAQTQDVVAVAEMSDGKFYMGKRTVKVTIGGCGG
ncbi:MAG: thiosulfate oxidation carrier protein SoxY [Hyphomicrobiaceae bacterium]